MFKLSNLSYILHNVLWRGISIPLNILRRDLVVIHDRNPERFYNNLRIQAKEV